MSTPQILIVGNLADEPVLRTTQSGKAVAQFTVIATNRRQDGQGNWVDGDKSGKKCVVWNQLAQHVAASLHKGMQVIVVGNERDTQWQAQDGTPRYGTEVNVRHIGPSLQYATAQVTKAQSGPQTPQGAVASNPWGQPQGDDGADPWSNGGETEPAF
ncbi:single-stranded DNA-binding protein [Bifidobacterium panos]|uniref:Single-stranded DNA-binding protein n=1 Tax=Bifidobacterium panos TaxID=2675321 RepID=A0ABX1T1E1_9BIFI|nr:single-stranded DNA-binding protein [Bifidobacterium sp. DSM 109963]NMN02831.1 single-stranded DNA-binding protein [Bifidobacterium sp. DSM 109963]